MSVAYQASRNTTDKEAERARDDANNAKNVRNAADVAIASKHPVASTAGLIVKGADKVTGGKSSEFLGKGISGINRVAPFGKAAQGASNKLAESGVSDKIGKAASFYSKANGSNETPNQAKNENAGGDQKNGSLPSSDDKKNGDTAKSSENKDNQGDKEKKKNTSSSDETSSEEEGKSAIELNSIFGIFGVRKIVVMIVLSVVPFFIILLLFIILASNVLGIFSSYDDAIGASSIAGEENGNIDYATNDKEQESFFERVNQVKLRYQTQGKSIDAYKIAAVYHVLHSNDSKFTYDDMTDSVIASIADAMFEGSYYSDSIFKTNLISKIFPLYATGSSDYESMADDVIKYIEEYESLIGKEHDDSGIYSSCASTGSCTYDIKGYYIQGKGNVAEAMQIKDLYVRLMQCGIGNGHNYGGRFGKPLEGEALVPFEKYVLGVAYQEIGPNAPAEAIKAQMIAARSYILARHKDMGGWRTLKEESGRWVIQVASCTQDQVYCDPDQGCSSNDGQWGQIHSGLNYNSGFSREAMPKDSPMRTYATETAGEVLINKNGYIIYTGYLQDEQSQFISLANKGFNYKQILLQVYNQGYRNYGASDILKASCTNSSATCSNATGNFASWLQTDPAWASIQMGSSGRTIGQIGCNVTSMSILIAKSGIPTNISNFNPGTFVQALNGIDMFDSGGSVQSYALVSKIAPGFEYQNSVNVSNMSRTAKLSTLKNILADSKNYVMAEVKGDTGQHWVAIDSVSGDNIKMMDPGSTATDMWTEYNWKNTSMFVYFRVR